MKTLGGSAGSFNRAPKRLRAYHSVNRDYDDEPEHGTNENVMTPWSRIMHMFSSDKWIHFGAKPIADNRQPGMAQRQPLSGIPAEKNIVSIVQRIPVMNGVNWQKIGTMAALIKLGMVKLKAIGFIKILYFLMLKVKYFMTKIFFKSILLLKFYNIFKFLMLPMFLLPLLAIIISPLVSSPLSSSPILPLISNILGGTDRLYSAIDSVNPTQVVITEETILVPENEIITRPIGQVIDTDIPGSIFDLDNLFNGIRYDTSELLDPTLKLFQEELSSEKCIERIACKMATTGKASVIPLWINW